MSSPPDRPLRLAIVGAEAAPLVLELVHAAFLARPAIDPPAAALGETQESIADALTQGAGLIAWDGDTPVGALLLSFGADDVRLRRVSVLASARGHGVASALAAYAEEVAADRGRPVLRLDARTELPETVLFWQQRGYRETHHEGTTLHLAKRVPVTVAAATAEEMRSLGAALAADLGAGDLVILSGGLGAGKTTLTQGLGSGLGVRGPITSPTFVISRVHPSLVGGPALVHVDAYRLGGLAELDDLDLDVSLSDSVTVVEWGEGVAEGLAEDRWDVHLVRATGTDDGEARVVRIAPVGTRWLTRGLALGLPPGR